MSHRQGSNLTYWSNFVLVRAFARQGSLLLQGRSQPNRPVGPDPTNYLFDHSTACNKIMRCCGEPRAIMGQRSQDVWK